MAKTEYVVKGNELANLSRPTIFLHNQEVLQTEANLAAALIERWGIVAGAPDGEDASGRQKLRRLTTAELVTEACNAAAAAYAEFRQRGWVLDIPAWSEVEEIAARKDKEAEDKRLAELADRAARPR